MILFKGRVKRSQIGKIVSIFSASKVTSKMDTIPMEDLCRDESWETVALMIFDNYDEALFHSGSNQAQLVEEH